ncbi:pimeloyl-ACP methyl ester carboxylesterase [Hamadaea flava]|uniref:Alpha/beta fold hydrolase n=1 Tax=Hamadaea flava TaxID=1742688 RepID=A0ABV8LMQ6_9ACTN|nr:alpha/beta hydrolase [Hamadaea flava]MCP2321557.1 pimeloyl-ACP methyl ester carboxylesterase [Hamadaea flava]
MTAISNNTVKTSTVEAPGAVITYDVRLADGTTEPALLMVGSPMDASGFGELAARFPDRTVVTYDPRGAGRSTKDEPASKSTPDQHADDLRRVIEAVGGPVDVFASSGGAINMLALVAQYPGLVRTLVAHEPPAMRNLPDAEVALAAAKRLDAVYTEHGFGAGMAMFIALTSHRGEYPAEFATMPAPDPAAFGLPTEDDGRRDDVLIGQNLLSCTHYEHDFATLKASSTRIVIGVGAESVGEMAHRGGEAIAARLGVEPVTFPSHHGGFLGENPWMKGDPDGFAATLRSVL